jgi:hypothetical protein
MKLRFNKINLLLLLFLFFMNACKKDNVTKTTSNEGTSDVKKISAQTAEKWVDLLRNIVANESINPPRAARVYAYSSIAMYESVVEGIAGNKSLQGQLNGFAANSIAANTDSLDYEIVLNEAISIVSKCDTIIPAINQAINQKDIDSINSLHDRILSSKTGLVLDTIIQKSRVRGAIVARAIINYASIDNFLTVRTFTYSVPTRDTNPSVWAPTDLGHPNPVEPFWGRVRTFTQTSSSQFEIPQNILFDTDTSSAFGRQAREVYNTVNNRTSEQNDIALWWRDATGTQTPAGHWMGALKYIFHIRNYKLDKAVELYALTAIATADAFISCWDAKFKYNLLRPETYIKDYIQGGWSTGQFDITPPFPEYPSGHSVCSGAAAKVLSNALGNITYTDSINVNIGYTARSFPSIDSAANEAGISRLYGGIHFREAIESGLQQGRNIGQNVLTRIQFR